MSNPNNELIIKPITGNKWQLVEPFSFDFNIYKSGVPAGFITDFASVPKILWSLIPSTGRYTKAAVIHDYLYSVKGKCGVIVDGICLSLKYITLSRRQCDLILREEMKKAKVGFIKRHLIYWGVRLFGWLRF